MQNQDICLVLLLYVKLNKIANRKQLFVDFKVAILSLIIEEKIRGKTNLLDRNNRQKNKKKRINSTHLFAVRETYNQYKIILNFIN